MFAYAVFTRKRCSGASETYSPGATTAVAHTVSTSLAKAMSSMPEFHVVRYGSA